MNRNQMLVSLLLLTSLAGMIACSSDRPRALPAPEVVRNVAVSAARRANIADLLEASGTVHAAQTSTLSSQAVGNIVEVRVHEGDRVQRGQLLATIDESQPRAALDRAIAAQNAAQQQLAAADSDLALAESTFKRYQNLYEKKSVSPQEFDEIKTRQQAALAHREMARAEQEQAKAALAQARTALDYTHIRAPFDGMITERRVDPGTLASPGLPIVTLEDVRRFRLEAMVSETDFRHVRIGQSVPVVIDALGSDALNGRVIQIVPAADPASRTFTIKIDLPSNPRLRSGIFGRAQFSRGERNTVLIPKNAVVDRGQLQAVFLIDQNKVATLRYITVGKTSGENVEVLAGLNEGERLVARPGTLELEGRRIEAAQ